MSPSTLQADHDKLRQLLFAAGAPQQAPPQGQGEQASDFDLRSPCRFTRAQLATLGRLAAKAGAKMSQAMSDNLGQDIQLQPPRVEQHSAGELRDQAKAKNCVFPLGDATGAVAGALTVEPGEAMKWVAALLGVRFSGAMREFSALEADLLRELIVGVVQSAAEIIAAKPGSLNVIELPAESAGPLGADDQVVYVDMSFSAQADQPPIIRVLMNADDVERLLNKDAPPQAATASDDELMRMHLDRATVTARVWVGTAQARMRDIMSLENGDVLLIQKLANDPVDVEVEGRSILTAVPVKCEGKYAVQIIGGPRTPQPV